MAAHRASGTPAIPLPVPLRRFVKFTRLPATAIDPVLDVLDNDDDLRSAVVEFLDADVDVDPDGNGAPDQPGLDAWLRRGSGWVEDYENALSDAVDELTVAAEESLERSAREELAVIRERLATRTTELERLRGELAATADGRDEAAARGDALIEELRAVEAERNALRDERARAVRELAATKALLAERIGEVKALRAELTPAAPPDLDGQIAAAVAEAVGDVAVAMRVKVHALLRELDHLSPSIEPPSDPETSREQQLTGGPPRRRRAPIRVGRGIALDSVEGVRALLATPRALVLVDGYNVTMSAWPKLEPAGQRAAFERLLAGAAVLRHVDLRVIYDGDDSVNVARSAGAAVAVMFTATGVEADDEIIQMAEELAPEVPVVVVSSDRRVVDGVRRFGANAVSSQLFLAALR